MSAIGPGDVGDVGDAARVGVMGGGVVGGWVVVGRDGG